MIPLDFRERSKRPTYRVGRKGKIVPQIKRSEIEAAMKDYFERGGQITHLVNPASDVVVDKYDYSHDFLTSD